MRRMRRKKFKRRSIPASVFLLVAGLVLGIVFIFGIQRWNAPISRNEAVEATAAIRSVEAQYGRRHHLKEIRIEFQDHDPLMIDGSCADSELLEKLHRLPHGTVVKMSIHPESDTILEMQASNISLLEFDQSIERLRSESSAFMYLGMFCFAAALFGLIGLCTKRK